MGTISTCTFIYIEVKTHTGEPALERKTIRLWHKLPSCVTVFRCAFVPGAQISVRLCPVKATPDEARESRSGESGTPENFKPSLSPNNHFKSLESKLAWDTMRRFSGVKLSKNFSSV